MASMQCVYITILHDIYRSFSAYYIYIYIYLSTCTHLTEHTYIHTHIQEPIITTFKNTVSRQIAFKAELNDPAANRGIGYSAAKIRSGLQA